MPPKFTEQQLKDALLIDMNSLGTVYEKELSDSPRLCSYLCPISTGKTPDAGTTDGG